MNYLDVQRLEAVDAAAFQRRDPYPWVNPAGLLTEAGHRRLLETLPDLSLFTFVANQQRRDGQPSHDRYALDYHRRLPVAQAWHEFVDELQGATYRRFLRRMLGRGSFTMGFHWHYTPQGCSVSPHRDAKRKLGSHIFYLNTGVDWDPNWGGQTLILDDGGGGDGNSNPIFEDFQRVIASDALGNSSLLFANRKNAWHGVSEIRCPADRFRKVFIVVIDDLVLGLRRRIAGRLRGENHPVY
jgi:hypothetical protein